MLSLYSVLLCLVCLLVAPLTPLLLLWGPFRRGLLQRLGLLPRVLRDQAWMSEGCLWVHAASLGEVNAVAPVVRELLPRIPRQALVVTCTSLAGREQARRVFPQAAACLLLPLDLPFLLAPWIRRFRPRLLLVAETEWWPNLLHQMKIHGAQVLVANGRLTERSGRRYARLGNFFAAVLEDVDLFAMQAREDADRVISLGARPARVLVAGNTKFDVSADLESARSGATALRRVLGWPSGDPVLVAGSTRPGEEAPLLAAFAVLKKALPGARLVLAPRHLERVPAVEAVLRAGRRRWVSRTSGESAQDAEVLLLDTLGELRAFYALAREAGAAWVGGSFRDFGGQNPLEAAALGVPVLFGPFMRHFPEVAEVLLAGGGARQAAVEDLGRVSVTLLSDAGARRAAGLAAEVCVRARAGASKATAELGWKLLLVAHMVAQGQVWRGEGVESFRSVSESGGAAQDPDWRDDGRGQVLPARGFGVSLGRGDGGDELER
ncbi:MAG: 3-deoxy-D-manno-octulosonic acid transferase [bacterium]